MSETGIPVTEQDQSLVQRLRAWDVWELDKGPPPPPTSFGEAADRIEALEKRLLGAQLVHESDQRSYLQQCKRIEALETDRAELMRSEDWKIDRIKSLEAALREIGQIYPEPGGALIARRALEEAGTKAGTGSAVLTAQE